MKPSRLKHPKSSFFGATILSGCVHLALIIMILTERLYFPPVGQSLSPNIVWITDLLHAEAEAAVPRDAAEPLSELAGPVSERAPEPQDRQAVSDLSAQAPAVAEEASPPDEVVRGEESMPEQAVSQFVADIPNSSGKQAEGKTAADAVEEKAAAERAVEAQAAAARVAAQMAATRKAAEERALAEEAAAELLAAEKAAALARVAAEKLAAERAAAEVASARKAVEERKASERAAAARAAAERAAAERAAEIFAERLAAERAAAAKAAARKVAEERALAEEAAARLTAERAAAEKVKLARAVAERMMAERAAAEKAAARKAAEEKVLAEKAAAARAMAEKAAADKALRDRAVAERMAAELLAARRAAEETERARKAAAARDALEKAPAEKVAQARIAEERETAQKIAMARSVRESMASPQRGGAVSAGESGVAKEVVQARELQGGHPRPTSGGAKPGSAASPELFQAPLKGDVVLEMNGKGVAAGVKVSVMHQSYPKSRHQKPLSRVEARRLTRLIPKKARIAPETVQLVIETAAEGIYDFRANGAGVDGEAECAVTITAPDGTKRVKKIGIRKVGADTSLVKILMPEGLIWDDTESFSGSIEDSESITRYKTDTGLVWKEYKQL